MIANYNEACCSATTPQTKIDSQEGSSLQSEGMREHGPITDLEGDAAFGDIEDRQITISRVQCRLWKPVNGNP